MLQIVIEEEEMWDEEKQEFVMPKKNVLRLEHSLLSVSEWESKWRKAYLGQQPKTAEETIDYIRCMTLDKNVDPDVYRRLTASHIKKIKAYIDSPMSATRISAAGSSTHNGDVPTSELIYYWMTVSNIPFECQYWHLNRLLTLIRICSIKNQPPKKRSKGDIMRQNKALNEARRRKLNTTG